MARRDLGALLVGWALAAAVLLPAGEAAAQSHACLKLHLRLAALPPPGNGLAGRYDGAIEEQRAELDAARRHAGDIGCGDALPFSDPRCRAAYANLKEMERNLVELEEKRSYLTDMRGGDADAEDERKALMDALAANGCASDRIAARLEELGRDADRMPLRETGNAASGGDSTAFTDPPRDDLPETATPGDEPGTYYIPNAENVITIPGGDTVITIPGGETGEDAARRYRTVCVRTCDGYYFPMSPSSSRDDFARDQQNCQSICPGTEVKTYYQGATEADTGTLMSTAADEPYSSLPSAFLYRRADALRPAGCGCGREASQQNYAIIAGEGSAAREPESAASAAMPQPLPRPDAGTDPETAANRDGGLTRAAIENLAGSKPTVLPPPGERKVRVVGPAFLPDPSTATGRPVPDRKSVQ